MAAQKLFYDRVEAGRQLAAELLRYRDESPIVLGLPRGGVPVAKEVADALEAPLEICVVRKVGAPGWPELGMGAVAEGGEIYMSVQTVQQLGASEEEVRTAVATKLSEVEERCRRFRGGGPPPDVAGKTVLVVDYGVATGGTARAALRALRKRNPKRLVLAVPVGSADTLDSLRSEADDIVCLEPVEELHAVGLWYDDFRPVTDDDVLAILAAARAKGPASAPERGLTIDLSDAVLGGDLTLPPRALGLVLFAHGSGSSRKSPRNRSVAAALQRAGLGTLLFDLLTRQEEEEDAVDRHLRFDIELLARRLVAATDWVRQRRELRRLPLGYFGASTGAAAALFAAVERPDVRAVVSRGGRPDLAASVLARVRAPTLLIVGGADRDVLALNRAALRELGGPKRLEVVAGATHLFEEPGALEQVADLAAEWFVTHLAPATPEARA